ncbi:hypothetical protein BD626DRAFT_569084 [Schizophyllum amplum]|uniref:RRM domain-containing protein n=1 Tax=Schizophyllum amplum TaxID=97359 RepID=A0A550CFX2_9AGAR|nr:hypothetical protein BD626DRAFT_569084 [Auriculariopsis ampla]
MAATPNGGAEGHSHPYLHDPLLYITNVPDYVSDEDLAKAFVTCGPFRPRINRDTGATMFSGTIEFKFLEKAERALATLQGRSIPGTQPAVPLVLSPYPPTDPPTPVPPPSAHPRLIKHLPPGYTDGQLYDLCRPFGALASARASTHFGADTGMVEFWNEDDGQQAEESLHCEDIDGHSIAVQMYQPRRASGGMAEYASAPSFVPAGAYGLSTPQSPPRQSFRRTPPSPFIHGPGQQVQLAPVIGPGSNSHSGLIDPCNLFCKNLDPEIDSNSLFSHFRSYGSIVSARVMRNENGESRGFGFVSFQTPDQAAAAMHGMNGRQIGSKQIVVRLHEPKQLRQEKLAARFSGHNGHPRSVSGATSPTLSDGGGSYVGWSSPPNPTSPLGGSPHPTPSVAGFDHRNERAGRRGSGSYYNAALSGQLNLPMRYDELSNLSPVVRYEVLTGELSRRVKTMDVVPADDVDRIVEGIVNLKLEEVVKLLDNPGKLTQAVMGMRPSKSPSPSASQDSRLLDAQTLNATASAPEHPSTPISANASLSTPPRTSSPSGSVPQPPERERVYAAVCRLESTNQDALTDLLMSLPKRERALLLFNAEHLRAKLVDAKAVLEASDDDEMPATTVPVTPQPKRKAQLSGGSPQTPDLSSRGPSATSSPAPATPSAHATVQGEYNSVKLARMLAQDIIKMANTTPDFPYPKPELAAVHDTNAYVDSMMDIPLANRKQKIGSEITKVAKPWLKKPTKVAMVMVDGQDDLRSLVLLMRHYPDIFKEKAILASTSMA